MKRVDQAFLRRPKHTRPEDLFCSGGMFSTDAERPFAISLARNHEVGVDSVHMPALIAVHDLEFGKAARSLLVAGRADDMFLAFDLAGRALRLSGHCTSFPADDHMWPEKNSHAGASPAPSAAIHIRKP